MRERGAAVLAGVAEDGERSGGGGGLEVSVAEDDVGGLAAELEGDPLDVAAAAWAIPRPTSVEPVKATLATSGCSTRRCPQTLPGPATTLSTPSGRPASSAISSSSHRGERRELGRLQHDRVAGRQRRGHLPGGDRQREVPRRDQPDDAERLAEGHVDAAGDRNGLAGEALGAPA